jgi:hypothetical protein
MLGSLQVWVLLIGQRHSRRVLHLLLILLHRRLIDLNFRWCERRGSDKLQTLVADQLPREPQEGLLEVVVGFGGDVVVLQVLLAVEGDSLGLDFALLDVDLVAGEDDRDVLADAHQVAVPVGHVLVGDARGDVEHDDAALPVDVVTVAQPAELLLSCRVPNVELDRAEVLQLVSRNSHLER